VGKKWFVVYRCTRWVGTRPCKWLPMGACTFSLLTGNTEYVITAKPFRGLFVTELRRKTWGRAGGDGELLEQRRRPDVKKVKVADRSSVKHLASLDSVVLGQHPAVIDSLGLLQYSDGSPRQSGYLGVWVQGSVWVVRLTDKDADATLTCEGRTFDEALSTLNLMLGADDAPWEPVARRRKKGG